MYDSPDPYGARVNSDRMTETAAVHIAVTRSGHTHSPHITPAPPPPQVPADGHLPGDPADAGPADRGRGEPDQRLRHGG